MGRKAGGADVFGYKTNENGEYVPVPEQAKIVQLIYQLTLKDYTLRQVRAELNRRGIRTARDRDSWSIAVLGGILRNDIYLGVYRFLKSKHGKDVDGSRYKVNRDDQSVVGLRQKPNHPPLIEPRMFDMAQQKVQPTAKKTAFASTWPPAYSAALSARRTSMPSIRAAAVSILL